MSAPRKQDVFASRSLALPAERTGLLVIDAQNWVTDEITSSPYRPACMRAE